MSRQAGIGRWASSEVYFLVNLFEKPIHNAVGQFSCFSISFVLSVLLEFRLTDFIL